MEAKTLGTLEEGKDYFKVAPGVWGMKIVFVNIFMIADNDRWVLVDAGLPGSANRIKKMAADLFGENKPPVAIIFTHGHFDHRGAIDNLLKTWNVPVYAHPLELPYLTGKSAYPPADPIVGGGMMTLLSVLYPRRPINLGSHIQALPENGSVPFLPDWLYIFTPGHAPGHISLFRTRDKVLIAGDAFVTTKQESAFGALVQPKCLSGPPKYFTPDWVASKESVKKLRDLHPVIAATGHGKPMQGKELTLGLDNLFENFKETAVPAHGRYVNEPARANKRGVQYIPSNPIGSLTAVTVFALTGLAAFTAIRYLGKQH
ncbi:MAG: Glyoxylase, beta-lactamase superfamily [Mucilaginibacter sp.]|nr:Glyoxylase, beta-lactamase superfamily [Mucilaginibacter sp.]